MTKQKCFRMFCILFTYWLSRRGINTHLCVYSLIPKVKGEEKEELIRLKDTNQLLEVIHYFVLHIND